MLILATDSTAIAASVALCEDERLLACYTLQNGNTHSETLLPMVKSVLDAFSLRPDDISVFACSYGPGSFTGVRIGASTIKGLAFGTSIPCIGVSTLEALAYNLIGYDGLLCPVMNARRSQVYNAIFRCQDGVLTRLCDDRAIPIAQLCQELMELEPTLPVYLTGDGYDITYPALSALGDRLRPTPVAQRPQSAYSVAQIARKQYEAGERTSDVDMVPVYLRPCQAERERMERLAQEAEQKQEK